ncbi:MAG: hypothetical protein ACOCXT_02180, partial [Candidatus Dojkabacteria bacterium]
DFLPTSYRRLLALPKFRYKSKKSGVQSTCEQYLEVDIYCLVEKYNGYVIYFSTNIPQNLPEEGMKPEVPINFIGAMPDTLEYIVLDAPLSMTQESITRVKKSFADMPEYSLKDQGGGSDREDRIEF